MTLLETRQAVTAAVVEVVENTDIVRDKTSSQSRRRGDCRKTIKHKIHRLKQTEECKQCHAVCVKSGVMLLYT